MRTFDNLAHEENKPKSVVLSIDDILSLLPSDEEIKELMTTSHYHHESGHYRKVRLDRIQGAKIIRDLIKDKIVNFS